MNTPLTIIAKIVAKTEKRELVKLELEKLIPITLKEEGCIDYDLHQDIDNPNLFLFYENWQNRETWQKHMGNQHLKDFATHTEDAIVEIVINEMKQIKL